jgi:hypothetical protein
MTARRPEDYEAWRERGRKVGRQLLALLDAMALEEAIRASGSGDLRPVTYRHPELGTAYRLGLQDALKEYRNDDH